MTDQELINLTIAVDLICTPYSDHYAASGIVLRAIKCRTPILVPNSHWFQFIVEEFGVGSVIPQLTLAELSSSIVKAKNEALETQLDNSYALLEQFYSTKNFVAHWMSNLEETEIFYFDDLIKKLTGFT